MVVAVGNPLVPAEQATLFLTPLLLGRLHPARLPEVDVEMDEGKAGLGRQRSRERALARSGQAGDQDRVVRRKSQVE